MVASAKSTLILLASNPSLDQVASGLSLSLSLPKSEVVCPTPMLVEFNRLVGVNKVKKELGNKNLTIRFSGYKADGIEKVSYDIENGEFQLTIVPKPGVPAPTQNQVETSYAGVAADLVILVGGTSQVDFPGIQSKDLEGAKIIHVGTSSIEEKRAIEFARPAASISEVTASLIKESGGSIDPDMATNLLAGIEDGSQKFSHPYVNADTFSLVSELMKLGGRRATAEKIKREAFPVGSIPGEIPQARAETPIEEVEMEKAPREWFDTPQIYKGTSLS